MQNEPHPPEVRERALDLYDQGGAAYAADILNEDPDVERHIPSSTIRSWAYKAGRRRYSPERTAEATKASQNRLEEKRLEIRELLLDKALDMLLRMDQPHTDYRGRDVEPVTWDRAPADACKHYATSAAILIDKYRLEAGEETSRHGVVHESELDREIRRGLETLARQRQG